MTTANNQFPNWAPSQINAEFLNKGSEAINIGDLLYWDTANLCVRSFGTKADAGSAFAQQLAMAPIFAGVALSAALASDATQRAVRVMIDGIWAMPCDSGTFAMGDYVGASYSAGARNQQVAGVGNSTALALGRVVKSYGSASAVVKCRLTSSLLSGLLVGPGVNPFGLATAGTFAAAGTTQANGTPLTAEICQVTGANATVGVVLPKARTGMTILVANNVAAILKVYGFAAAETINTVSGTTAFSQPASKHATYFADTDSTWNATVSA